VDDTGRPQRPDGPGPERDLSQVPDQDRAGQFTGSFDAVFAVEGIRILASPLQAPRANAMCDRIIGSLRRELLDQMLRWRIPGSKFGRRIPAIVATLATDGWDRIGFNG
jgi:hypothetical protein